MSDSIEEQVMQALVNALTGIVNVANSQAFVGGAFRGRIVSQNILPASLPAASVFRIVDRENPKTRSWEKSKVMFQFGVDIAGSAQSQPDIDQELIDLKSRVKAALVNNNLNGLCGSIEYRGADTANFAPIAQGREILAFETLVVTNKTDPWSQA